MAENVAKRPMGALGASVRGASARVVAASFVGWTFLWMYIRESLYFPRFSHLPFGQGASFAFLAFVACALVIACAMAVRARSVRVWAQDGRVVCGAAAVGTIGLAALLWCPPSEATLGSALFCALCYLAYAAAFCVLFFAWIYEARRQSFTLGIEAEVVLQFAAVFASYILTDDVDGFTWRLIFHALGLAVSGGAFLAVWLQRRSSAAGEPSGEAPAGDGTPGTGLQAGTMPPVHSMAGARLVPWFVLLGISLFVTGMLAYTWHFTDRGYAETDTDLLVDVFTFAIMGGMAAFAFYMARRPAFEKRMPLDLLFGVVLAALVVFFAITVTLTLADGHLFGLARIIKRIARVATFVTVLVLVYQCDLDPARPFAFAFLVPSVLPRALQMALAATPWGRSLVLEGGNLMAMLLATGFFLVMCLVVFCMLNMDGGLARGILREGEQGPDSQAGERAEGQEPGAASAGLTLEAACEAIGREYALTRREREVMRVFAQGASAQEAALAFSVSVGTVNTHARTLYRKLDIHSKQELADLVGARMGK